MQKANRSDAVLVILFFAILSVFGVSLIVSPHHTFSEEENRALTTWSNPTLGEIADGSFSKELSLFCADQFPLRGQFTALTAYTERLLGKGENHGILFGKDGYLIPRNEYESLSVADQNLSALSQFVASAPTEPVVLFAPRSVDVMIDKLPDGYDPERSQRIFGRIEESGVQTVEILPTLETAAGTGREVWYRTDHHWTTDGAYLAYVTLGEALGITPYPEEYFSKETVGATFFGTSDSTAGGIARRGDTVTLYRYPEDDRFQLQTESGAPLDGFYDRSALEKKDKYRVFLGGNQARLTVTDPTTSDKPRLLLIKDSFANCLVPFLALHFDLDVMDLRYMEGSFTEGVKLEDYDEILVVQGLDTLATDPSLKKLLY